MLNYIFSIIEFSIIIYCACYLFKDRLYENGWDDLSDSDINLLSVITISTIPVFRLFVVVILIYGYFYKKGEK